MHQLYQNSPSAAERRNLLIEDMTSLDQSGLSCKDCIGNCCTFQSNSMQMTPLETYDLYLDLKNRLELENAQILTMLDECIKDFRLDQGMDPTSLRKTYTCPFYLGEKQGCQISRKNKPYGCLAFNATETNVLKGSNCQSNISIQEKRAKKFKKDEEQLNKEIKEFFGFNWDKLPIPLALKELMGRAETLPKSI